MPGWYRRYRRWALAKPQEAQATVWIVGVALLTLVLALAWLADEPLTHISLAKWFALVGGPIAALDAFGAARARGKPTEAWIRLAAVWLLCWLLAFALWQWQ